MISGDRHSPWLPSPSPNSAHTRAFTPREPSEAAQPPTDRSRMRGSAHSHRHRRQFWLLPNHDPDSRTRSRHSVLRARSKRPTTSPIAPAVMKITRPSVVTSKCSIARMLLVRNRSTTPNAVAAEPVKHTMSIAIPRIDPRSGALTTSLFSMQSPRTATLETYQNQNQSAGARDEQSLPELCVEKCSPSKNDAHDH